MSTKSLRVHFVPCGRGENRRLLGILLRKNDGSFEAPPPSATGHDEDEVAHDLERTLARRIALGEDGIDRYLWDETFGVREVRVDVHPLFSVKKTPVIGSKIVPLRLSYAWCPMASGGYRVMLPRFGGWFVLEDLALAPEVLKQAVSTSLLGAEPRWLYDFRHEGEEYVRALSPSFHTKKTAEDADADPALEAPTLHAIAEELVSKAARGKLAAAVGPSAALDEISAMPEAFPPPSLLFVGPRGVGKSTLVRRLAKVFATRGRQKRSVHVPKIWSTSADRILAGMVYLGMWQARCLALVGELEHEGDYLYVGRLPDILVPQSDGASIAELLDPATAASQISLIAECTSEELERARRKNGSFVGRFVVVNLSEPTTTATLELLTAYAAQRGLAFDNAAARRLVQLLGAFVPGSAFPGKLCHFVDWLAQEREEKRRSGELARDPRAAPPLYPTDVAEAFSRHTGVPANLLRDDVSASEDTLAAALRARVIGRDGACHAAARVIARYKAGLQDPDRPIGSLLFVGPTGVGKTELAKQLARVFFGNEDRMIRLDLGEFQGPFAASRLTDVSPGARSLARRVAEQPLSLVLLDEVEKASAGVFDVLLGILGEGRLTDDGGRLVDFRSTVVVMTSNLGVREGAAVGFGEGRGPDFMRAVRDFFRPELFQRIDHVLPFRALSEADVEKIVDLEIDALTRRAGLALRELRLVVTPAARAWLAVRGYHKARGARPLGRLIEEVVVTPIAAALAADPDLRGREARVIVPGEHQPVGALVITVPA